MPSPYVMCRLPIQTTWEQPWMVCRSFSMVKMHPSMWLITQSFSNALISGTIHCWRSLRTWLGKVRCCTIKRMGRIVITRDYLTTGVKKYWQAILFLSTMKVKVLTWVHITCIYTSRATTRVTSHTTTPPQRFANMEITGPSTQSHKTLWNGHSPHWLPCPRSSTEATPESARPTITKT